MEETQNLLVSARTQDDPTKIAALKAFQEALGMYERATISYSKTDESDEALFEAVNCAWNAAHEALCAVIDAFVQRQVYLALREASLRK